MLQRCVALKIVVANRLVYHTFLYCYCIAFPSPHDYDVEMPNFTFYGVRKQANTKFSFSF